MPAERFVGSRITADGQLCGTRERTQHLALPIVWEMHGGDHGAWRDHPRRVLRRREHRIPVGCGASSLEAEMSDTPKPVTNEELSTLWGLFSATGRYDPEKDLYQTFTVEEREAVRDRVSAALMELKELRLISRRLLEEVNEGEPYDYEQGMCFWCSGAVSPSQGKPHDPDCAFAGMQRLLTTAPT